MLFSRDLHVLSLPKTVDPLLVYMPVTLDEQTDEYARPRNVDVAWPKHRISRSSRRLIILVGEIGIAGCYEVDRGRGTLDAPILSVAPNGDVLRRAFAVDVRGLPVSLRGFLQNLHIKSLLGHHLLQSTILFL